MTLALTLTLLAGSATALGGLVAVHRVVRSDSGLAAALAFAAGAMVLVSLVEIVPKGVTSLAPSLGLPAAAAATLALTALGAGVVVLLGRAVGEPAAAAGDARTRVRRAGIVAALAVAAHNFPEGLATFVATLEDPRAGATLAVAIAVHNIPEGVAVAAPVYGAGGSRARACAIAGLTGLAEPVGALLGYLLLATLLPAAAFGAVFGLVAGVMLHLGLTELLPSACRLAPRARALTACAAGGGTMAISLLLLGVA